MQKTLLLCFIHGFKGGEATFGDRYRFTEDLAHAVADRLPKLNIKVIVYPRYETRGDLYECVGRFREWLQNNIIEIEVKQGTPSPTVDPSVRTILIGHSMGGIVAAETLMAITGESTIHHEPSSSNSPPASPIGSTPGGPRRRDSSKSTTMTTSQPQAELNSLMFPYIQAVLAFDTPYLGISPGVVAHGAEGHYNTATAAFSQFNSLKSSFGWAADNSSSVTTTTTTSTATAAKAVSSASEAETAASGGAWGKWGTFAMVASAVGTIAAAGGAAYMNRDKLSIGWSWVSSHLEFVSCLSRKEELKRRMASIVRIERELNVGFANLYTRLGAKAEEKTTVMGTVVGKDRTFCNLPGKMSAGTWKSAVNELATDETGAHMGMFERKDNPGYDRLVKNAADFIAGWTRNDWYEDSAPNPHLLEL